MADDKLILGDGTEFDLSSLYGEEEVPEVEVPAESSAATISDADMKEFLEFKKQKEASGKEEETPAPKPDNSNLEKLLRDTQNSNFVLVQKFENQKFENSVKSQHPAFEVDETRLLQDKILGVHPNKSRDNQLKEYIKNIAAIGAMFNAGHYKLNQAPASKNPGQNDGLPESLKDFDPNLINDPVAMAEMRRYNQVEHKKYLAKFEEYSKVVKK